MLWWEWFGRLSLRNGERGMASFTCCWWEEDCCKQLWKPVGLYCALVDKPLSLIESLISRKANEFLEFYIRVKRIDWGNKLVEFFSAPHSHINQQRLTIPLFALTKCQLSTSFTVVIQPLSTRLIMKSWKFLFHSPTDAAPQFLYKLEIQLTSNLL